MKSFVSDLFQLRWRGHGGIDKKVFGWGSKLRWWFRTSFK